MPLVAVSTSAVRAGDVERATVPHLSDYARGKPSPLNGDYARAGLLRVVFFFATFLALRFFWCSTAFLM